MPARQKSPCLPFRLVGCRTPNFSQTSSPPPLTLPHSLLPFTSLPTASPKSLTNLHLTFSPQPFLNLRFILAGKKSTTSNSDSSCAATTKTFPVPSATCNFLTVSSSTFKSTCHGPVAL